MIKNNFWKKTIVHENDSIENVLKSLNNSGLQISLIVDKNRKLKGTITDGDLRTFILKKKFFSEKCKTLMNKKPVIANSKASNKKIISLMKRFKVNQIPIVSKNKKILGLKILQELINEKTIKDEFFLFMAGGRGKRLMPLTNKIPKPMIKISGKPILEKLIENVKNQGFKNIIISTHYLHNKIKKHFKKGEKFKLNISYFQEKKPMGTAGSISLINKDKISENFIVSNSDIICKINYNDALDYHIKNKSDVTLLTKNVLTKHNFSVIDNVGKNLKNISEKPTTFINYGIGVYIFNKKILKFTKRKQYIDMIEFIKRLQNKRNIKVLTYPINDNWLDIGNKEDLKKFL